MFNIDEVKKIKNSIGELYIKKAKLETEIESLNKEIEQLMGNFSFKKEITLENLKLESENISSELEKLNDEFEKFTKQEN